MTFSMLQHVLSFWRVEKSSLNIIRSLDTKKAHGCDDISISMIEICDSAIVEPLCLIFEKCLETGVYPTSWKRANIIPVHKKNSRQSKSNYRPISLEMHLEITKKLEQVQYSAALAVTGTWRCTSRQKLYEELGWETLYHRRWHRRLTHFFCLRRSRSAEYLFNEIPQERQLTYSL